MIKGVFAGLAEKGGIRARDHAPLHPPELLHPVVRPLIIVVWWFGGMAGTIIAGFA